MTKPRCACVNPKAPRRSFGSLRILPSGRHQARYRGPDDHQYTAPVTFETHVDADAYLGRVRADISRDQWKPPNSRKILAADTFGAYAESWLRDRELKPRTRAHYDQLLARQILPTLSDSRLTQITPAAVRAWYASLDASRPTLRAHAYSLLRSILATAVTDELVDRNPCVMRGAGTVKRDNQREGRPATADELARLIDAMPDHYRAMVLLSTWCALRLGEVTALHRSDVDLTRAVVHVRRGVTWVKEEPTVSTPKSGRARDVTIPPHVIPALAEHLETHAQAGADGLLFPNRTGGYTRSSTVYASFWPARRKAGRPDLRWHDLRHTGATLAAQSGATIAELMVRLGHATPAVAIRYQHVAAGRAEAIAARMSELATTD